MTPIGDTQQSPFTHLQQQVEGVHLFIQNQEKKLDLVL